MNISTVNVGHTAETQSCPSSAQWHSAISGMGNGPHAYEWEKTCGDARCDLVVGIISNNEVPQWGDQQRAPISLPSTTVGVTAITTRPTRASFPTLPYFSNNFSFNLIKMQHKCRNVFFQAEVEKWPMRDHRKNTLRRFLFILRNSAPQVHTGPKIEDTFRYLYLALNWNRI